MAVLYDRRVEHTGTKVCQQPAMDSMVCVVSVLHKVEARKDGELGESTRGGAPAHNRHERFSGAEADAAHVGVSQVCVLAVGAVGGNGDDEVDQDVVRGEAGAVRRGDGRRIDVGELELGDRLAVGVETPPELRGAGYSATQVHTSSSTGGVPFA